MAEEQTQNNVETPSQPAVPAQSGGKKSKGPLVIIIVVIAVLAALGLGFFFLKDAILSAKGLNGQVLNPNCRLNDKDLCKFMSNFKGLENMSAKTESTINGKKNETLTEVQGSDKIHMITTVEGKEEYNIIVIGNTTYTKDYTDNKWWKSTQEETPDTQSKEDWNDAFEESVNNAEDKTTYKKIGKEACGKLTCFKYQVIDPAMTDSTEYIWFDTKKYSLRKTRSEGKDGVVTETTYTYENINITEPSPTKEMTNPAGAYEDLLKNSENTGAALSGLTDEQIKQIEAEAQAAANDLQLELEQ